MGRSQDSIICLKRCKKTHRTPRLPSDVHPVELDTCLRVMHGTLLGLYPLGVKRPVFGARVRMTERLGGLLLADFDTKLKFVLENISLVKLCFIEHTINLLVKFMPCERDLLASRNPQMELFETLAVSMCDSFRQDMVVTGDELWAVRYLDASAHPLHTEQLAD
jgi:hypothetical protein